MSFDINLYRAAKAARLTAGEESTATPARPGRIRPKTFA